MKREPSWILRIGFGLEMMVWLGWFIIDATTIPLQLEVGGEMMGISGMPVWIALSFLINIAVLASSALGVYAGQGLLSRRFDGVAYWGLVFAGASFRFTLGAAMCIWLLTVSGLQSV